MTARHPAIVRAEDIEDKDDGPAYPTSDDRRFSFGAALGRHFGFKRIGIHEERLPPGTRTSLPHAEKTEDEFVYVLSGAPDVWLDGVLHRLGPGDAVGFPAGDGLAHTFINDTDGEVRLLVVGDKSREDNRIVYPVDPEMKPHRDDWWDDWPARPLGPHDGRPKPRR